MRHKYSGIPSIKQLFREAWQTFTKSVLSLFTISVFQIIYFFISLALIILILAYSGVGSFILKKGFLAALSALPTLPSGILVILGSIVAICILNYIFSLLTFFIASILVIDSQGRIDLKTAFKKSIKLLLPSIAVAFLTYLLTYGANFVFLLPGILIGYLLLFAQFEVIINNQRLLNAVKRSVLIVSTHFWAIFIRIILIALIYVAIAFVIPNLLNTVFNKIYTPTGNLIRIISFIINLFLGFYSLSYIITLYKHAAAGIKNKPEKNIMWIFILAIIGWLILASFVFFSWKTLATMVKNFQHSPPITQKATAPHKIMNPQALIHYERSQKLVQQMRAEQTSKKSSQEIIAEVTKLDDENIVELKEALSIEPNNAELWSSLGGAYTWVNSDPNSLQEGLTASQKAEKLEPNNINYIIGTGIILIQMNRNEEAITELQKNLYLTYSSGDANLYIARANANLKKYDLAKEYYTIAIKLYMRANTNSIYNDNITEAQKELANLPM